MKFTSPAFFKFVPAFVNKVHPLKLMASKSKYRYNKENFHFTVLKGSPNFSEFDKEVISKWTKCMEDDLFRFEV